MSVGGGAENTLQLGLNQWTSVSLIKIMLDIITLDLITIEIYIG